MNVTKQQIVNGTIKYIKEEVINKITDKPFKIALAFGISMAERKPEIVDKIFEDDTISKILSKRSDGTYDIDEISEILEKTLNDYGDFPVKIPPIKFISPTEKELSFSSADIRRLKSYIEGVAV